MLMLTATGRGAPEWVPPGPVVIKSLQVPEHCAPKDRSALERMSKYLTGLLSFI